MLLTPGPTPVPEFVRASMSKETLHHRTPEFKEIFTNTRKLLLELLDMDDCVILASSGTGAMEACVTNLSINKVLTINSGKFGERFGKICDSFGIDKIELKYPWDTPANIEDIIDVVKQNKIDTIFIQICESAGGLRHPVEEIAKEVKKIDENILIVADGITAVGVEKIDTTYIDALITGSQKALMLPPGAAMIGFSQKAIDRLQSQNSGYYFNLLSELKKQQQGTTAYTAPTTLIIGLEAILQKFSSIGYSNLYQDTSKRAKASRKALEGIGLRVYPTVPAVAMTAIYFEGANMLRNILQKRYNVSIAGGQDHLGDKLFRINHMGLVQDYEANWVVSSIELALQEMGIRQFDGTASKIFLEERY